LGIFKDIHKKQTGDSTIKYLFLESAKLINHIFIYPDPIGGKSI